MEIHGDYETIKEISSAKGAVVSQAKKAGASGPKAAAFIIKFFSPKNFIGGNTYLWSRREGGIRPVSGRTYSDPQAFIAAAEDQKKAWQAAPAFVAPIHESNADERGAWYVTKFYPRSLKKILEGRVELSAAAIHHLLRHIASGSLAFKKTRGKSHGNIKPSNVLIGGDDSIERAPVVLSDPWVDPSAEPAQLELADLRALGEICFQLVRRKDVSGSENWPLLPALDWSAVFGPQADAWRELCNELLDPNLSLDRMSLESLQPRLAALRPKTSPPLRRVALAAALLVPVVLLGYFLISRYWLSAPAVLKITSDPTQAAVWINGENTLSATPFSRSLPPGPVTITLKDKDCEDLTIVTNLARGQTLLFEGHLTRHEGWVTLLSEPEGAEVFQQGQPLGKTPLTQKLRTGDADFVLQYPGLEPQTARLLVEKDGNHTNISRFPHGGLIVRTTPPNAAIWKDGRKIGSTPYTNLFLPPASAWLQIVLEGYLEPSFWVEIPKGGILATNLSLQRGFAAIVVTSEVPGAEILVQDWAEGTPKDIRREIPRTSGEPAAMITISKPAGMTLFFAGYPSKDGATIRNDSNPRASILAPGTTNYVHFYQKDNQIFSTLSTNRPSSPPSIPRAPRN